jgi:LysM repeat protein
LENTPPNDVTPATTYVVVRGDNLTRIAKKNKTTVADLMKANHLTSSSVLDVGRKLIIPGKAPAASSGTSNSAEPAAAGAVYTVKAGDTLAAIAQRAGSTTAELKQLNKLNSDYVLVGQELKLPPGPAPVPAEAKAVSPAPAASPHATPVKTQEGAASPRAASVKTPEGAVTHEVKPGETVGGIAKKYHVRTQDLLVANNIADPRKVQSGQVLVIPGAAAQTANPVVAPSMAAPAGPATAASTSGGSTSDTSTQPALPANNQDLDSGLKAQGAVPVIKVDDAGETKTP